MITKKELQDYAKLKGLNLGNAEKDYLIDIALSIISRNIKNELVFKGGTCLYKFYKLNRFSEDIDFSAVDKIDINALISKIILNFNRYGIKVNLHSKREPYNSVLITLRAEGPLFNGTAMTYAGLGIDINLKSSVLLEPEFLGYDSVYPEIAKVSALCMKPEEIFAEKIRALMSRNRARDLFDLNFLIEKNIYADLNVIAKKMEYYNEKFDLSKLISRIKDLEKYWKKELTGFTILVPDFNPTVDKVISNLKRHYSN